MRNHSYDDDFDLLMVPDLHENEITRRSNFHMKDFALVLKQRHKRTRKWSIYN